MNVDLAKVLTGNRRALAKAITLVESQLESHIEKAQELLAALLPHAGKSMRVGISGTPGVGKSTFIEAFGECLTAQGKKVAVLAVDPSSPVAGGSILGDKTRMENLSRNPNAFIRPSPASGHLGGVAQKTRESILLCEAAGFDVILVETVGVGQSEFDVAAMVDFFLVLVQPNGGDELQGIKKGILELAHALVINKADGEGKLMAQQAKRYYKNAIDLVAQTGFWKPQVMTCSARENIHIDTVWAMIEDYQNQAKKRKVFDVKRAQQNKDWMNTLFMNLIEQKMWGDKSHREHRAKLEHDVIEGQITPLVAAKKLAELF